MPRSISRCPKCHEPVSHFAAGCAICGTDLEAARAQLAARQRRSPLADLPRPGQRLDWPIVVIAFVLALGVSPIGLVVCLYWAHQRRRAGETVMMWLMAAAAALSVAALIAPVWFWSHLYGAG